MTFKVLALLMALYPQILYNVTFKVLASSHNQSTTSPLYIQTILKLLDFYNQIDQMALRLSLPVPGRRNMEAGWAQYLVGRYSVEAERDISVLIKEKASKMVPADFSKLS